MAPLVAAARENLKLIGELTGKLREGAGVNVGVFSAGSQDAEGARERILTELARLATRSASPQVAPLTPPAIGDPDRTSEHPSSS
jgi:hypothetical protein